MATRAAFSTSQPLNGVLVVADATRFETPADRLLGQAISHVAVSQKSVSEIHVSPQGVGEQAKLQCAGS